MPDVLVRKNMVSPWLGHHENSVYSRRIKGYDWNDVALCAWLRFDSRSITKGVTSKTETQLYKMSHGSYASARIRYREPVVPTAGRGAEVPDQARRAGLRVLLKITET